MQVVCDIYDVRTGKAKTQGFLDDDGSTIKERVERLGQ